MKNIIPQKLRTGRRLRGLSMEELSVKMDRLVTRQAISKYETGKMRPSDAVVHAIARALCLPLSYFYTQPVDVGDISFRIDDSIPAQSVSQMISLAHDKIERYLRVEKILAIPQDFKNPLRGRVVRTFADVEQAAQRLRARWELGTLSIFSVYEMLESFGIRILEFDCGVRHVVGFSTMVNKNIPLIVVNVAANFTTERKRFTALHELGHLLLHFDGDAGSDMQEKMCNHFAGALLCPAQVFTRELGNRRERIALDELTSLKTRYGISVAAAVHRAKDLGVISDRYYNYIFDNYIHKNKMEEGWGGYPIDEHTDRFERLVKRIAAEKYITPEELDEILDDDSEFIVKEMTVLD